jgi:hypothetical protein
MANEINGLEKELKYDYHILENARVAGEYLKSGNTEYAKAALGEIAKKTSKDGWGARLIAMTTNRGTLEDVISSQLGTYFEIQKTKSVGDVVDYYSKEITSFIGDDKIEDFKKGIGGEILGKNYLKVLEDVGYAERIIKNKKEFPTQVSDEEVKKAEKTLEKYQWVSWVSNISENKVSEFRYKLEQDIYKKTMSESYKEMTQPEEPEEEGK